MMNIVASLELDNSGGDLGAQERDRLYQKLEIVRRGDLVIFRIIGMNNTVVASGTCEPFELARIAELLGETPNE